jgi:ectoine hydroxylase-related dioxygenase (phytanoyl-CoA dioxygenase family)
MRTKLTQAQIDHYRENGFVVIKNFLSPRELAAWRAAVDDAVGRRGQQRILGHEEKINEEAYYNNVFIQRVNLWMDNEPIRKLMLDKRLGKVAATLAGVDGIRIWHDQALIKQPWANPTGWHLDNPYWSFSSRDAITIWVALDDVTLENGCMWFIPGTHKTATFDNATIGPNMGDLFKIYPDWKKQKAVPIPMKAGSWSFHNGIIAHAAGANMTPGWRRAMTCAYMPDGSTFNGKQNILRKEQIAQLTVGDVLADDNQTPLIYHPTKKCVSAKRWNASERQFG